MPLITVLTVIALTSRFQVDRRNCGANLTSYEQVEYECVPGRLNLLFSPNGKYKSCNSTYSANVCRNISTLDYINALFSLCYIKYTISEHCTICYINIIFIRTSSLQKNAYTLRRVSLAPTAPGRMTDHHYCHNYDDVV